MTDYKIHKTELGDVIPCDSCASEVPTTPDDWGPPYTEKHERSQRYLCEFCAESFVGNMTRDLKHQNPDRQLAIIIAQAVNFLRR